MGLEPGAELNAGEPVEPRQAATVIVLRGGADTLEVLLAKRNPAQRFMGGAWVFPGGAVEAATALGAQGRDARRRAERLRAEARRRRAAGGRCARRQPNGGGRYACRAVSAEQLFICTSCGFIYDPAEGDPDGGIPPGTAFGDIPDDWFCPVCGARKKDFEPYEG